MGTLVYIFNNFLYKPLFNALILLYKYLPGQDFGVAVIALTILIKLLLYPLGTQAIKNQKALEEIQPKVQEIQKKYKDNKAEQGKALMDLYRQAKISPFSGFLPLLIQIPILIALYRLFSQNFQSGVDGHIYSFLSFSGAVNPVFLGIVNLAHPSVFLAIIAGAAQFWQAKTAGLKSSQKKGIQPGSEKTAQFSQMMQKQMLYLFPFFTALILFRLPSAVALFWIVSSLFTIVQQYLSNRPKINPAK